VLRSVSLPALRRLDSGLLMAENPLLERLEAPMASEMKAEIWYGAHFYSSIAPLPALIVNNPLLEDAALVDVMEKGTVVLANSGITNLVLGSLTQGAMRLESNTELETVLLPRATMLSAFHVRNNAALESITAPQLTSIDGSFNLEQNPEFSSLDGLSSVASVDSVTILNNAKLAQCEAEAFALTTYGSAVPVAGNDYAAICN
jgi:hypothetical protein